MSPPPTITSGSRVPPREFPTTGFTVIPLDGEDIDEEHWPWYTPQSFYPVHIGEVIQSRYQVLYKLGFGTASTVWMCRDLDHDTYVCIKSMMLDDRKFPSIEREIKAYELISKAATENPRGFSTVRQAIDQFRLHHAGNDYQFLVHEPLGLGLGDLIVSLGGKLSMKVVWSIAKEFLITLEAIHNAKIVHTDISARNIHFRIQDETIFKAMEEDEITNPSTRKILADGSAIYSTKVYLTSCDRWIGAKSLLVLCDFGEARTGKDTYEDESAQPHEYRAPEVFLRLPWSTPVDIWSFGCMIWDAVTGERFFPRSLRDDRRLVDKIQLAAMAVLFGPPPQALLDAAGPWALQFFNEDGSSRYEVDPYTLESVLDFSLKEADPPVSPEQSQAFLAFLRRIFVWEADKRPSASDLLKDPWITATGMFD